MLSQSDKSDFILATIKEVEAHKYKIIGHLGEILKSTISKKIKMVSSIPFYPFGISSARYPQMEYQ